MQVFKMSQKEIAKELENRINDDIRYFKGNLPEKYSVAWNGYIAGLYEWKVLLLEDYKYLISILPDIGEPDPIAEIFEGREEEE